jgi:glucoamylase
MKRKTLVLWTQTIVVCAAVYVGQRSTQAQGVAPDGPGGNPDWLPANKTGFGTSYTTPSNVWFTLQGGRLSEVYYPRLDTPSVRNLDFVVTDGQSFAIRAQDASTSTRLVNPESLTYQIVNTDTANRWRLTTTYVTDPTRPTLLINVDFTSLNGRPYQLYAVYQPQLNNPLLNAPLNESGVTQGNALLASDALMQVASGLVASPAFTETSNGYLGTNDGWTDLSQHYRLTAQYSSASDGTVVQTGRLPLTVAMSRTANEGDLLPEQVWDNQPPASQPGFASGTGTTSATPLAWTHAQFIRLAFDIAAGRLLEQPAIVADRYLHR